MSLSTIEFRHLRYFVAVVEHRSFRGAALRLHVSQPPLTRQVRQLEEALGVTLLLRKPHGVEPTDAGSVFFDEAKNLMSLLEQGANRAQLAGQGRLGRLDVGIFGSAVLDVIPRIIQNFRKLHPKVKIVLHNMDREAQIRALRERRLTVGFNRFFDTEPDLSWEVVSSEPMRVALPARHPLARKKVLALRDLQAQPLIHYPNTPGRGFNEMLMRLLHRKQVQVQIVQEVDDVVTAVSLVSSGLGLCMVLKSACNLRLPGVTYRPLARADRTDFELCAIHRSDDASPLLRAFLKVVREQGKASSSIARRSGARAAATR